MKVLVTGAAGNAGQAVCEVLSARGITVRMADVTAPPERYMTFGEFVRCDTLYLAPEEGARRIRTSKMNQWRKRK